jgi:DNA polymerase-3 subunit alpha
MAQPSFVHLNVHTEYSLVDGLLHIKNMMQAVAQGNMAAVAMTDLCNLFAMVKFYRAAHTAGVKPIIGAEVWLANAQDEGKFSRLILLCQNQIGYKHLTQLISRSYTEGQQHTAIPVIEKKWLTEWNEGLIALSGAQFGDIGQAILANQNTQAETLAKEWQTIFPNRFYLELQRVGKEHEEYYIQHALNLAHRCKIPVVATNAVCFQTAEDFEAHEARVCIREGWRLDDERRPRRYTVQQYLRSEQEMLELFKDIPTALMNSVEIAKRCNLELTLDKSFLPNFTVPEGMTLDSYFETLAFQGLEKRFSILKQSQQTFSEEIYIERLKMEISVISRMGFTGYFLIVADFVGWAKQQGIFVAPGRGSGAGSLVAYALEITDLDPIIHDLLFERFLNPERISMPDFDIDFCMEGRDRVIEYVSDKYGKNSVAQIITFGSMAAKAVVRDVGRVLGFPYGFCDKIAKLIPFELGMTLKKAMIDEPLLQNRYDQEEDVKTLIDLAMKLEGVPRNVGKHAAGVVIAPSVLTDFTPLYCEADGNNLVTQFDKDDVEAVGLVKFDFLGLRTLTIMDWALQTINQTANPAVDLKTISITDKATFDLLKSCQTIAIFQLESRGFQDLIRRLQPDHFDDIMALVALFRPGPLQSGMVDDFINRKHGRERVEYPHPLLEPILRPTYGVIVYQEQVMQIAQVLAGYTLGSADILRKAMGKKKPEEMAKQRAIFVDGATERGVDGKIANQIFDLMEKFAGYGFNKSHSASYALLAYQTAWLKQHYPAEFMAAVLSSDMDNTDKIVRLIEDCQHLKLKINAPHINRSQYRFTVEKDGSILYGLGAIKGVGSAAVENILEIRNRSQLFADFFEFCRLVDTRKTNRKVLEALIRSGALDCFQQERAVLMASVDAALQAAEQHARTEQLKQKDLFGSILINNESKPHYLSAHQWSDEERLAGEKETLGWYMSGHPIERFESELSQLTSGQINKLKPSRDKKVTIAGYVIALRVLMTKSGARMAYITLEDRSGRIDVAVLAKLFESNRHLLNKDQLLVIEGEVSVDHFTDQLKMTAASILDINEAREQKAKKLSLNLDHQQLNEQTFDDLKNILQPYLGGQCEILIYYQKENTQANLVLGSEWFIKPSDMLMKQLYQLCGERKVKLEY